MQFLSTTIMCHAYHFGSPHWANRCLPFFLQFLLFDKLDHFFVIPIWNQRPCHFGSIHWASKYVLVLYKVLVER